MTCASLLRWMVFFRWTGSLVGDLDELFMKIKFYFPY